MEKFCVYCGKPIEENAKFCPFCGKPAAVQEEQPEPAPQPIPAPAEPVSAPQAVPARRGNGVLYGAIAVVCAVLALVVVLALGVNGKAKDPWADVPNFDQSDMDDLMATMLPGFTLLSYDHTSYNAESKCLNIYGCRVQEPEGCLLDFSDLTVDLEADLSDPENVIFDLGKFEGTTRLKEDGYYTITDGSGNYIEVAFEGQPYVSDDRLFIVFPDVYIVDVYWLDVLDISDPTTYVTMWFMPNYGGELWPYELLSEDDEYTIYLNELCEPASYTDMFYT